MILDTTTLGKGAISGGIRHFVEVTAHLKNTYIDVDT